MFGCEIYTMISNEEFAANFSSYVKIFIMKKNPLVEVNYIIKKDKTQPSGFRFLQWEKVNNKPFIDQPSIEDIINSVSTDELKLYNLRMRIKGYMFDDDKMLSAITTMMYQRLLRLNGTDVDIDGTRQILIRELIHMLSK